MPKVRCQCNMSFVANFIRFLACKNFENRLRFDRVTESLKVGTFFETQCSYVMVVWWLMSSWRNLLFWCCCIFTSTHLMSELAVEHSTWYITYDRRWSLTIHSDAWLFTWVTKSMVLMGFSTPHLVSLSFLIAATYLKPKLVMLWWLPYVFSKLGIFQSIQLWELGFATRVLPNPKNWVTQSFFETKSLAFDCLQTSFLGLNFSIQMFNCS